MKQSIALPSPARVLPRGELRLVNRSHPLPAELAPPALAPALPGHPDILLEARAAAALTALVGALGRPGEIVPVSGFRPHWEQQQIWDAVEAQPGVLGVDRVATRLFGDRVYVDVEIRADACAPLVEAHAVAQRVHDHVERGFPQVKHCMVHVNPELACTGQEEKT